RDSTLHQSGRETMNMSADPAGARCEHLDDVQGVSDHHTPRQEQDSCPSAEPPGDRGTHVACVGDQDNDAVHGESYGGRGDGEPRARDRTPRTHPPPPPPRPPAAGPPPAPPAPNARGRPCTAVGPAAVLTDPSSRSPAM